MNVTSQFNEKKPKFVDSDENPYYRNLKSEFTTRVGFQMFDSEIPDSWISVNLDFPRGYCEHAPVGTLKFYRQTVFYFFVFCYSIDRNTILLFF